MNTVIFFDVDGVLIHGFHAKPQYRKMWTETLEDDLGVKPSDFVEHFIRKSFADVLVGKKDLYPALKDVLPHIGYHDDPQVFINYWLEKDSCLNDDLFVHVKVLANMKGVDLYIATNQEKTRANYLMNELGFNAYFKDIFNSGRVGCMKTDPNFYKVVEQEIGHDGQEVIFFDDSQDVVDAANQHGWQAHQFDTVQDLKKSSKLMSLLKV